MNDWLLEIAFGPVQGFIAAARRSRDLWAGSRILSEVARAAANSLRTNGAELIYPVAEVVERAHGSNLSNVLLARIENATEEDVRRIAGEAQQQGRAKLAQFGDDSFAAWTDALAPQSLSASLWHAQLAQAIDSYAAWSVLGRSYRDSYEALKHAFAARKNTRNFPPQAERLDRSLLGVPKSSLDGINETVLPAARGRAGKCMGLSAGEQLDALGCIKRSYGRKESFTALTRLAADAWLRGLTEDVRRRLADAYKPLVALDWATRCTGNEDAYKEFPFDAGLLFGGGIEQAISEAKREDDDESIWRLKELQSMLDEIGSKPNPYVALLVGDGDRIGAFVDRAASSEEHSAISKAIGQFADRVPNVAREHRGHAIFNGGEDLMVAFPVDTVISGAQALAKSFEESLAAVVAQLIDEAKRSTDRPTLRVGVAICHVAQPMGLIRHAAERAEKLAKGDAGSAAQGNALGLILQIRTGHEAELRYRFSDAPSFADLSRWIERYRPSSRRREFSGRVAYDIRGIAATLDRLSRGTPGEDTLEALVAIGENEFERVLERAQVSGGEDSMTEEDRAHLRQRREALLPDFAKSPGAVYLALGNELIVARWMAARTAEGAR